MIDGDCSWFNNPQFRIQCDQSATLYISLLPASSWEDHASHVIGFTLVSMKRTVALASSSHLWDAALCELVCCSMPKGDQISKCRGQEASLWSITIDPLKVYHLVLHTLKRGLQGTKLFAYLLDTYIYNYLYLYIY